MNLIDAWKICPEGELLNRISTPKKMPLDKKWDFARSIVYFINQYGMKQEDLLADDWVITSNYEQNHYGFGEGAI